MIGPNGNVNGDHATAGPTVWRRVEATGRVALTFDDCDSPHAWSSILDVLEDRAARATFFPLGMRVEETPQLAARTLASGHGTGSHSYDHTRLAGMTLGEVRRRLHRDLAAWRRVAGALPSLLRPPYGEYDAATLTAAAAAGFRHVVLWDVDPRDWTLPGEEEIVRRVMRATRAGSIVLLHAVDQTAVALGTLIDRLRGRGLEPDAIPALLGSARSQSLRR